MSVKIRLTRTGKSRQVSYRIVAQDTRSKRDGKFLEILGFYNPYNKPPLEINREKLATWTKKGAKPTLAVESLIKEGTLPKRVSKRKLAKDKAQETPKAPEAEETAAKPQAAAEAPQTAEEPKVEEVKTEEAQPEPEQKSAGAEAPKVEPEKTEEKAAPTNP